MKIFSQFYARVLVWAKYRHASWYLAGLSFAESSFFPVPPDIMLVPMALAQRNKAWWFASITTIASVIGGMLGYTIGFYAFETIEPWLQQLGYMDAYLQARDWFDHWGILAVFLAGFTPIPYKIFTISAGVVSMAVIPFIAASLIGRGSRFFLLAAVIYFGGERMERYLFRYMDRIGWLVVLMLIVAYVIYQFYG
jgi:membrane protein YqaA with SNARE-associated domain